MKETASITVRSYAASAIPHLEAIVRKNEAVMQSLVDRLVRDVPKGQSLLVFGSGHSGIFAMELYHRAGGASFVLPLFGDYLMPTAGPSVVRILERTPGVIRPILDRAEPKAGEMIWIASQSGINSASVDMALESKARGLHTVAFTSVPHSQSVKSRHPSGKRLFEVCDEVVDLGGHAGDACVNLTDSLTGGPLSTLGSVMLGHSILVAATAKLEQSGYPCVYASVNTADGESRNRQIEEKAKLRDPLLR
jgi:uncharacterized phosphosugar-binding protein